MAKGALETTGPLPEWADRIRRKYLRGEANLFLLHHNIYDRIPHGDKLVDVPDFVAQVLLASKKNVVVYDPSSRARVLKKDPATVILDSLSQRKSPSEVLPAIEELLLTSTSTAVIVKYVEIVAPAGEMSLLSDQDRVTIATLHRWSLDERFGQRDNVVFLLAEQLAGVHPSLVSNPRIAPISVPLPDLETRAKVCRLADPSMDADAALRMATHTAGLKAIHIQTLLAPSPASELDDGKRRKLIEQLLGTTKDAGARADKLTVMTRGMSEREIQHLLAPEGEPRPPSPDDDHDEVLELVRARKREIIETECFGLIEFIDSRHDFSAVGGIGEIKKELLRIAGSIRAGDRMRVPMGLLFVGAMGTGKTFVAGAFARESGIAAIKLKNFRSKWVGATESNLEKVLMMLKALGPILFIIDEGDRSFGDAGDSDGGTSSRVIARIKEFMSDPENRGQVVFILMTNRPDKLDVDIKRAGRLDRKIPFFYASEPAEIEGILGALMSRYGVASALEWPRDREATTAKLVGYSNAEIEAIVLLANEVAHEAGTPVGPEVLAKAIHDYLPSRDESMLRYMELLAVFEASHRSMLPAKYRDLSNEELDALMRDARVAIASELRPR